MANSKGNQLGYTITHRFDGLDISDEAFDRIIRLASWEDTPQFYKRGRMAMHVLETPVAPLGHDDIALKAVKMKGVGVYNPETPGSRFRDALLNHFTPEPQPPTTQPLNSFVTYPHFGINQEAEYCLVYGALAPVGGILHDRALLEYTNAKILLEHNVPSIVPLAVLQYEERLTFSGKPMGAALSLMPEPTVSRLSEVQFGAAVHYGAGNKAERYYDRILDCLEIDGDPAKEETRLEALCILVNKVGKLARDFTLAGLYRYSPELSNYEFDFARKEPVLTDLDSSRQLKELPPKLQTLQALRDLASVTYRVLSKFYTPSVLGKYTFPNLIAYDPLCSLLQGYFPNVEKSELEVITKEFWDAWAPHFFLLNKHREAINSEWDIERRKSYKMDHDFMYVMTMTKLFPLFKRSVIFERYPSELTLDDMHGKAERFLGERYDYFNHLCK